jgi:hypothetical protein
MGRASQIGEKKNRSHEIKNTPDPAEFNGAGDRSKVAAEQAPPDRRGAERAATFAAAASGRENASIEAVFGDAEVGESSGLQLSPPTYASGSIAFC